MLSLYFIYLTLLWVTSLPYTQAFTTQLKHHARAAQLRSFPCPNAEDIAPCKCEYKGGLEMNMICDNIKDEQELYDVFHSRIPFPRFNDMRLNNSSVESLSENIFGEATFKYFYTIGIGNLKFVDPKAFIKSTSTLRGLFFGINKLSSFPFDTLALYKNLRYFSLSGNPINTFPTIESQTLRHLYLARTLIEEVPANALDGLRYLNVLQLDRTKISKIPIIKSRVLGALYLGHTQIETIPAGALDGLPRLSSLTLVGCPLTNFPIMKNKYLRQLWLQETEIETIPENALDDLTSLYDLRLHNTNLENMATGLFRHIESSYVQLGLYNAKLSHLRSHQFEIKNASTYSIRLNDNQIATVEVDTFKGINCAKYSSPDANRCHIDLRNNRLTTLPEAVWRPVIEAGFKIKLGGNILTCGCDVAWLVLEPSYHELVADARCHSGQLLVELDPQIYKLFCSP